MQDEVTAVVATVGEIQSSREDRRIFITGRICMFCRYCGALNVKNVRPSTWRVRCQSRKCRRMLTWSVLPVPVGYASHSPVSALPAAEVLAATGM